jgi:ubiquinone/menaquinone biosynthesis C-methylase UbiE
MRTRLRHIRTVALAAAIAASASLTATSAPLVRGRPAAAPALAAAAQQGRLFPPQDLGLLESPDREQWNRPDLIMDLLKVFDGAAVADLGAGGGWFTIRLSRRVGPNGRVYAQDVQRQMLEAIQRRVRRENLTNVQPLLGTTTDPRLPSGQLDAALIVDAFHEMHDPAHPNATITLLANIARGLKPQGRLGIVEFLPGGGGPGPDPAERVEPEVVIQMATEAGLVLVERELIEPFMYMVVFGKAAVRDANTSSSS